MPSPQAASVLAQRRRRRVQPRRPVEVGRTAAGQARLDWLRRSRRPALGELMAAYEVVADTYLSVSTPVQTGAARAARARRRHSRARFSIGIAAISARFARPAASVPAITVLDVRRRVVGGAASAGDRSEEALVLELLTEDHVLVHPGFFFDFAREAFLVVSLLVEPGGLRSRHRAGAGTRHRTSERRRDRTPAQRRPRPALLARVDAAAGASASSSTCRCSRAGCGRAGQSFVQILPITEIPEAETSPYSALTAMALDPIYISLPTLEDFQALGGEATLHRRGSRRARRRARASSRVEHHDGPGAQGALAAARLRAVSAQRRAPAARARAQALRRVHARRRRGGSTTTRSSRRSRGAARAAPLVGMARAAGASRTPRRCRRRSDELARRNRLPQVRAVGRGRAVGGGAARSRSRCRSSAICRS